MVLGSSQLQSPSRPKSYCSRLKVVKIDTEIIISILSTRFSPKPWYTLNELLFFLCVYFFFVIFIGTILTWADNRCFFLTLVFVALVCPLLLPLHYLIFKPLEGNKLENTNTHTHAHAHTHTHTHTLTLTHTISSTYCVLSRIASYWHSRDLFQKGNKIEVWNEIKKLIFYARCINYCFRKINPWFQ